jgi:hypothetical protein
MPLFHRKTIFLRSNPRTWRCVSAAMSPSIENQSSLEANSSMTGDRLMSARHPGEEESKRSK